MGRIDPLCTTLRLEPIKEWKTKDLHLQEGAGQVRVCTKDQIPFPRYHNASVISAFIENIVKSQKLETIKTYYGNTIKYEMIKYREYNNLYHLI